MDWLTAENIVAFTGLAVAIGTLAKQHFDGKRTAKKEEVDRLQDRIAELETKLSRETLRVVRLMEYIGTLQLLMRKAGLQVPEMPTMEEDEPATPKVKARKQ